MCEVSFCIGRYVIKKLIILIDILIKKDILSVIILNMFVKNVIGIFINILNIWEILYFIVIFFYLVFYIDRKFDNFWFSFNFLSWWFVIFDVGEVFLIIFWINFFIFVLFFCVYIFI